MSHNASMTSKGNCGIKADLTTLVFSVHRPHLIPHGPRGIARDEAIIALWKPECTPEPVDSHKDGM
jgi:hypothetical protein